MRRWQVLALAMLAVTALFNVLLLKQMPDASARSMGPVRRPGETAARRLGGQETLAGAGSGSRGLLKRWVLRSAPRDSSKAPALPDSRMQGALGGNMTMNTAEDGRTNAQKYLSHPHFSGGGGEQRASPARVIVRVDEVTDTAELGPREGEASELEEVFGRMQDREAGQSRLAGTGDLAAAAPGGTAAAGAAEASPAQQQALLDMARDPHAPLDPPPGVLHAPCCMHVI
jgi:hypothetical protein